MASSLAKLVTVLITVPTKEVGLNISRAIVTEKLAACVNIVPAVTSVYMWEGKLEEGDELLMIVKTKQENLEELEKKIHILHPYDVPEFLVIPIEKASPKYAEWLISATTKTEL